ncbi:MAG TPA: substrate-binding domain-containing protein [Jatrophihabitantaceae bacterium]|jgi:D-xylose transport system substrate-binding protein|nr:substrate-binding domain-containing protein [Jatrophihabitantaceae bacterium]
MRKSALSLVAVGIAAAVAVSGCSSSKKSSSGSTGTAGGSNSSASGKPVVGVILPDTTTSNRYTLYDQPLLQKAFDAAGIKATIQNAHGSNSTFVSDAQTMITQGVKVLLIDPADPATGISVEQTAAAAGVQVIDYDRVNLGGSAKYYVSFDNEKVGELQGQGLLDCLSAKGITSPNIIQLNGGTDIDNNAVLFKAGAHKILDAKGIKAKVETDVKGWDNTVAATDFQQAFTQDPSVQAVLAANDGIAAAAISTLKQHHLQIPVTGQDATIQGLQYILQGDQCLTIFKDVKQEADAASKLAIALAKNDTAAAAALATGSLHDPKANRDIPSVLLTPTVITKANVKDVITAGALTAAQICQGITAACAAAGIS